jgi:peroxiredoxin
VDLGCTFAPALEQTILHIIEKQTKGDKRNFTCKKFARDKKVIIFALPKRSQVLENYCVRKMEKYFF